MYFDLDQDNTGSPMFRQHRRNARILGMHAGSHEIQLHVHGEDIIMKTAEAVE